VIAEEHEHLIKSIRGLEASTVPVQSKSSNHSEYVCFIITSVCPILLLPGLVRWCKCSYLDS